MAYIHNLVEYSHKEEALYTRMQVATFRGRNCFCITKNDRKKNKSHFGEKNIY